METKKEFFVGQRLGQCVFSGDRLIFKFLVTAVSEKWVTLKCYYPSPRQETRLSKFVLRSHLRTRILMVLPTEEVKITMRRK